MPALSPAAFLVSGLHYSNGNSPQQWLATKSSPTVSSHRSFVVKTCPMMHLPRASAPWPVFCILPTREMFSGQSLSTHCPRPPGGTYGNDNEVASMCAWFIRRLSRYDLVCAFSYSLFSDIAISRVGIDPIWPRASLENVHIDAQIQNRLD